MRTTGAPQLMLAAHDMPAEACAALQALAATHGWHLRSDGRAVPHIRSGEVVLVMAHQWSTVVGPQPPHYLRGLLLLTSLGDAAQALPPSLGDLPAIAQAWPCDASVLLDHVLTLLAATPLHLDAVTRTVVHRGQPVHLTPKECRILQALMAHAGEAVDRASLEAALHAWGQEFESNTLDVHVHRLRRKLPDAGIRAVRGYGYVLIAQR